MAHITGVDGCKGGWIAIRKETVSGEISTEVYASARRLVEESSEHDVLAIDIPIGLTDSGPRQCDVFARKMLGAPRGSSVFPAPIRPALAAKDRQEADSISRSIDGKGVGAQTFAIYWRVREIDELMRKDERARQRVYEVHPELCFMAWNEGKPISKSKRSHQGMEIRLGLVDAYFGEGTAEAAREKHRASLVADDDIYDAFAALWKAERIRSGQAEVIPDPPPVDSMGIRMGMWY